MREFNKGWQKAKDQCLSSSPFSQYILSFQSTIPLNKRRVRKACLQQAFPTAITNPHWRGQKVQQSRQSEAGWLTLRLSSLIWAAVVLGTVPQAAETTPEALRGSALVLQQKGKKLPETLASGVRSLPTSPWDWQGKREGLGSHPCCPHPGWQENHCFVLLSVLMTLVF